MPRSTISVAIGEQLALLRCEAGQPCPKSGWWHTPAGDGRRERFESGTVMPALASDYGLTIWQWDEDQTP
jgi:hypothetical protein